MSKKKYQTRTIVNCCKKYFAGVPVSKIVKEHKVPRSTVYYWVNKYRDIPNADDIPIKGEFNNLKLKYEKAQQICEVLKLVNCNRDAPLRTKLNELEKLYGQFSIHILCEALGVSRGTFYNHIFRNKRENSSYAKRRAELSKAILEIYEHNRGVLGSDKILSILHTQGYHTSKKMVRELMKNMGLKSFRVGAKKDYKLWKKMHETKNVVHQVFTVAEPNQAWVSDCTRFVLDEKTYHLCAILDLYSRKIVAYKISSKASTQLVTATFKMAMESRKPRGTLVFHSDRGCQYTSYAFRRLLMENGVTQSFSRAGNPYDNGAMESFFSSFKQEEIYRTSYRSFADCKAHIAEYMEFYNSQRPHRTNNYKTPNEKEELFFKKAEPHTV